MNKLEKENLYKSLIDNYGNKQIVVAIEELSELQKELCKFLRGKKNSLNLIEEIADVYIMLEQMIIYFNLNENLIDQEIDIKLIRTKERMLKNNA